MMVSNHENKDDWRTWDFSALMAVYSDLENEALNTGTVPGWLEAWSRVAERCDELYNRLYVATTVDTSDQKAQEAFEGFMQHKYPLWQSAEQRLKQKFLKSGLSVKGMEIPMRNMRAEADLFREANLELFALEEKINSAHDQVMGSQTVEWQGQERTARQMEAVLLETAREQRRAGWEKLARRQLRDREIINRQWGEYYPLREKIAANAGLADYRAYIWKQSKRFDYTPEDCKAFHQAIETVVVPAVTRLAERRKKVLGVKRLRYYDLLVDLSAKDPLRPFQNARELTDKVLATFSALDPVLGGYFRLMDREGLLDLDNRVNKAYGAYCADFTYVRRPFIFANAVGIHDDVQSLLHEGGHAFHCFERFRLPYFHQFSETSLPMEFAEVASMSMEFLAAPYLESRYGSFYSSADAARALAENLETALQFWPFMSMVDEFQHWAYENPRQGADPAACDAQWARLEARFRPHIDWSGYEDVMMTGWQRKDHIHQSPFYYIEYGLALLGAAQVWRNSLSDPAGALAGYRAALSLGGTASLPDLFKAAGARLAFNAATLRQAVDLMESRLREIEADY